MSVELEKHVVSDTKLATNSSNLTLYYMAESPPCRAVLMVAAHIEIPLQLKLIDLSKGKQFEPDFCQINPLHCLPTLVDEEDGFTLWESRAIMIYLTTKYQQQSRSDLASLYPSELKQRAKVDQWLYFDIGRLYSSQSQFLAPIIAGHKPDKDGEIKFRQSLEYVDNELSKRKFVASDQLTLADLSILASLSLAEASQFDFSIYPNVCKWIKNLKESLPYYKEINEEPMMRFTAFMTMKKAEVNTE